MRYKAPDLNEGEKVVVHSITNKHSFINLKFNDKDEVKNIPNIHIADATALSNRKIKTKLEEIKKRIALLDGVYTCYSYLLVSKDNELSLVSMSIESVTLSFDTVKKIATTLDIPVLKPLWSGTFTPHNISAFLEDIFIQKQ